MGDIRFTIAVAGLSEMIDALRAVQHEGIHRAQAALDSALDGAAEWSREMAHEHSGALKASQSHSSTYGRTDWSGEVAYTAPGAPWELEAGGSHAQFIDGVGAATEAAFKRAVVRVAEHLE